ncbi:hypothetical protein BC835DRAFT_217755 [Cytidiella melzeri]|nr:hypothetical protein BC835DRAFT_217755 [Cytidiella melzeri]
MVDSSYLDHDFDPRQHPEVVLQGWLLGLNVIALVNIPELRHLRFVYHYLGYSLTEAEIRAFSWSRLRSVCSRFSGLRTVETDIYHQDPLDPRCKVVAECARHELRDLQAKGVRIEDLHRLGFYCEQKSCRWYGRVGLS